MLGRTTRLLGLSGAVAGLLAILARPLRVQVVGDSMAPTLRPGDRLLACRWSRLRLGDLVVVTDPRQPARLLVKRVALGPASSLRMQGRLVVTAADELLLLGDNPRASTDGRTFGPVRRAAVRARVRYRYAPPHRAGRL